MTRADKRDLITVLVCLIFLAAVAWWSREIWTARITYVQDVGDVR